MKVGIIIAVVLLGIFIMFQIYATMTTNKTETQVYKVIKVEHNFKIRYIYVVASFLNFPNASLR